jgi:hypothetical protein
MQMPVQMLMQIRQLCPSIKQDDFVVVVQFDSNCTTTDFVDSDSSSRNEFPHGDWLWLIEPIIDSV